MLTHRFQRGFTLIELMITIVIIGVLLMLGLPAFTQWLRDSQIRTAADSTLAGLQMARAEAVRRNSLVEFLFTANDPTGNPGGLAANTAGPNWAARFTNVNSGQVELIRGRGNNEGTPNATFAASQGSIIFNSLGRVTNGPVGGGNITITINNALGANNRRLSIVVTPGGQIRMCDPQLPAGNVQAC